MNTRNPREVTLKVIYDILEKGDFSNLSLNNHLNDKNIKDIDKNLITELSYGTLRKILTIDYIIQKYSKIKLKKISPWILNIVRIGVYQIFFCDRIPDFAVCSECVVLANKYGHKGSIGFVNGLLRNIARNKDNILFPDKDTNIIEYLSIKYSMPNWLVDRWINIFGISFTEDILKFNYEKESKFTIRINILRAKLCDLQEMLKNDNILTRESDYIKEALIIDNPKSIVNTKSYKNGLFHIQSESSMLVAEVLEPKSGECIIDLCSAPGGKTTHIAEKMNNNGKITAMDLTKSRLKQVKDNAIRLGIDIIDIEENDGTVLNRKYLDKADRVLVDVPCTGFGVINKRPDILFNRNFEDLIEISKVQRKILYNAARYVKPGGIIVYSTCTIEPIENELQIKDFLETNKNFIVDDMSFLLPKKLRGYLTKEGFLTIYPHINNLDGFFIARLVRKEKLND